MNTAVKRKKEQGNKCQIGNRKNFAKKNRFSTGWVERDLQVAKQFQPQGKDEKGHEGSGVL